MESPIDKPDGDWWSEKINRRETIWLGLSGGWALTLFGWMIGWSEFGDQNQVGESYKLTTEQFLEKVRSYKQAAGTLTVDGEEMLVPHENDVYVGALQWDWDGLPVVLRPGETYRFHLGSYDVQHGFSVRNEDNMSQQISLQILPGYEWVLEMSFDDPGTYQVVCNEFCGTSHRSMHGKFVVRDHEPVETGTDEGGSSGGDEYGGWFTGDASGGPTPNFDGETADRTGQDEVTVTVGGAEDASSSNVYGPPAVRVSPGTTVTFEWASVGHNVAVESQPDGADWDGHGSLEDDGFTTQHTFETEGVYKYYCDPHLSVGMKGVVEVA